MVLNPGSSSRCTGRLPPVASCVVAEFFSYRCRTIIARHWRLLDASDSNPYWGEIEHFHNFSRKPLYALIEDMGFTVVQYGISERYRICMEVMLRRD
jgi:hypothetical protein